MKTKKKDTNRRNKEREKNGLLFSDPEDYKLINSFFFYIEIKENIPLTPF